MEDLLNKIKVLENQVRQLSLHLKEINSFLVKRSAKDETIDNKSNMPNKPDNVRKLRRRWMELVRNPDDGGSAS